MIHWRSRARATVILMVGALIVSGCYDPPPSGPPPTAPPLDVTGDSAVNAVAGKPFARQLTSPAGPGTWSLVDGALPAGLTLSPSGLISGVPTGSGGLWAADVHVDTGSAGLRAQVEELHHLWGWTSASLAHKEFPGTLTGVEPDSAVTIFENLWDAGVPITAVPRQHHWRIGTDGVAVDGNVITIDNITGLPAGTTLPDDAALRTLSGLDYGVLVTSDTSDLNPCPARLLHDVTQGPANPPVIAAIPAPKPLLSSCTTIVSEDTLFFISVDPQTRVAYIDVRDLTGALLRSTTLADVSTPIFEVTGDGSAIRTFHRNVLTSNYEVLTVGRTEDGDDTVAVDWGAFPPVAGPSYCGLSPSFALPRDTLLGACYFSGVTTAMHFIRLEPSPAGYTATVDLGHDSFPPNGSLSLPILNPFDPATGQVLINEYTHGGVPLGSTSELTTIRLAGGIAGSTAQTLATVDGPPPGVSVQYLSYFPDN